MKRTTHDYDQTRSHSIKKAEKRKLRPTFAKRKLLAQIRERNSRKRLDPTADE